MLNSYVKKMVLWPTNYNPFTFLSRNHQHFALTGYIALIACHRRLSTLHRRRQSNTASSALFWINADLLHLATFLLGRHKEGTHGTQILERDILP